ncbi:alpha/beta hydrolase [Mesoflavibacter sp. SCSIO 43206]|uniref:alpha/beta hydrolase n=1 Tax=Mesoflavibacter sp. SCSIO 43206 TaxID=2779362 RepID=UPI001CA7D258|nr:alpha/beta hydrolase-fold protein [Mesoflavibacter sp. SCSIO 43206]UAB76613.1 esterase [Mesoflavibacter sp. SCSIO 43206]
MKRFLLLLITLVLSNTLTSQTIYKEINSEKLGESRQLKIQVPRNYDTSDKKYPVVVVFDGDYLFEIVAGNVDYAAYWEDMPEAIVVGINQYQKREADCYYSEQNSLPIETGAAFFEFVSMELIPFIDKNFRTENFKVAVGHGQTANFINYYLLKGVPLYQAYISLSPSLAPDMKTYLTEKMPKLEQKIFYYLAAANNDKGNIKEETEALAKSISSIENDNLLDHSEVFTDATHYSLPAQAIPKALQKIFLVFQPISLKEYKETVLNLEGNPVDYLKEKYETIETLFGIKKPILINDFKAIEAAIKKKEKYEYFEDLGNLARKEYPDTLLGHYYLGRFYEETGKSKKAMKTYQSAYVLQEIGGITKDLVLELAEQIKADFGY